MPPRKNNEDNLADMFFCYVCTHTEKIFFDSTSQAEMNSTVKSDTVHTDRLG